MAVISVLGSGGWGTALAILCENNNHDVTLWGKFEEEINNLRQNRETPLLKGVRVPDDIKLTCDIGDIAASDVVIIATPSFAVRETAERIRGIVSDSAIIVSVSKGFERETLKRFTEVIGEELPKNPVVALSGPSHAEEVAIGMPTSIVAASRNIDAAKTIQQLLSGENFRVYTNNDVIGVETGAALKNIIAMAAGVCDGLNLGDNTIAALITRGIHEIAGLGVKMGANRETFSGLSGIGDLIVTCTSRHSRNRRFGKAIGGGMSVDEALESVGMTVESYYATAAAKQLGEKYGVELPIVTECYKMLYENGDARQSIKSLMGRAMKHEISIN